MDSQRGRSGHRFNRVVTLLVVGAWLLLLGFLLKDHYVSQVADIADSVRISGVESDDWFLIRIRGAYSGFGRSRQFKKGDGWRIVDDLRISLNLQGSVKPVKIVNQSEVDKDFRLKSFHVKVSTGIISFEHRGRMEDQTLVMELPKIQGGGTKRLKLAEIPRMSRSLGLPVPLTGLNVGEKITMPIFDPMDGNKWEARIYVLEKAEMLQSGQKVEAWKVKAVYRTLEVTMWVDGQGKLLKGIMPLGITVIRADRSEIAQELSSTRELPELLSLTAVPLEGTVPDPVTLRELKIEVVTGRELQIPSDNVRQAYADGMISLKREKLPKPTYSLPCTDSAREVELSPSRFVRSDHPDIVKKAREIVGTETNPVKAGRLITEWVYKYLQKVPTPAVPDAYTVLQTRQGDCNEHAVLAAALARAVGLPAQIAVGLVYLNEGFYYHAWVTYWAGSSWFSADPLLNAMPVDPTHIALLFGDVDKHVNVLSFLGRLRFRLVAAE
ncbi:MAG: transglutaminase-like domain-containing protein [Thermodesulfobacteriota bacterium]